MTTQTQAPTGADGSYGTSPLGSTKRSGWLTFAVPL
jgi:hypothetical protein